MSTVRLKQLFLDWLQTDAWLFDLFMHFEWKYEQTIIWPSNKCLRNQFINSIFHLYHILFLLYYLHCVTGTKRLNQTSIALIIFVVSWCVAFKMWIKKLQALIMAGHIWRFMNIILQCLFVTKAILQQGWVWSKGFSVFSVDYEPEKKKRWDYPFKYEIITSKWVWSRRFLSYCEVI